MAEQTTQVSAIKERIDQLLNEGEVHSALDFLTEVLAKDPTHKEALAWRGHVYAILEENEKAIEDYSKLIEMDPNDSQTYNNRASVLMDLEKYEEALKDINKALELKPDDSEAYYNRAVLHECRFEFDDAIQDYTKALEIEKDDEVLGARAAVYMEMGKFDLSLQDYETVLKSDEKDVDTLASIAAVYMKMDKYQEALDIINKAIEYSEGEELSLLLDKAEALMYMEKFNDAFAELQKMIDHEDIDDELHSDAYLMQAVVFDRLKNFDDALKSLGKSIELFEDNFSAYGTRGDVYNKMGRYEESIKDSTVAINNDPYPEFYANRAFSYIKLGKLAEAEEDVKNANDIDDGNYGSTFATAMLYHAKGEKEKADEIFKKFLNLNPPSDYWFEKTVVAELHSNKN